MASESSVGRVPLESFDGGRCDCQSGTSEDIRVQWSQQLSHLEILFMQKEALGLGFISCQEAQIPFTQLVFVTHQDSSWHALQRVGVGWGHG